MRNKQDELPMMESGVGTDDPNKAEVEEAPSSAQLRRQLLMAQARQIEAAHAEIQAILDKHGLVLGVFAQSQRTGHIEPINSLLLPMWEVFARPVPAP
jgi:hypothetical protein